MLGFAFCAIAADCRKTAATTDTKTALSPFAVMSCSLSQFVIYDLALSVMFNGSLKRT
jgi:hypothetical protein